MREPNFLSQRGPPLVVHLGQPDNYQRLQTATRAYRRTVDAQAKRHASLDRRWHPGFGDWKKGAEDGRWRHNNWRGIAKDQRHRHRPASSGRPSDEAAQRRPLRGQQRVQQRDQQRDQQRRRVSVQHRRPVRPRGEHRPDFYSDQQREPSSNVESTRVSPHSQQAGLRIGINTEAATRGQTARRPPLVYDMAEFRTSADLTLGPAADAAAESSYTSYQTAEGGVSTGANTYPAAQSDSHYGQKAKGKYPAARPGSHYGDKPKASYPAARPSSHYGEPPPEEPHWQQDIWAEEVTPLPFVIDPPMAFLSRPVPSSFDTCDCRMYNNVGAVAGTTAVVLNVVLFALLAIANGGGLLGRSAGALHPATAQVAGVMQTLPPLSPEISHQALRFACDLMGLTEPDYSGYDNFVPSLPTDLGYVPRRNLTGTVTIGEVTRNNMTETSGSIHLFTQSGLHGPAGSADHSSSHGGVHIIQGTSGGAAAPPGSAAPVGVHVVTPPAGVHVTGPASSVHVLPASPGGVHVFGPAGSTHVIPGVGVFVARPPGSPPALDTGVGAAWSHGGSVQATPGSSRPACHGLCIETVNGVRPVGAGGTHPAGGALAPSADQHQPPRIVSRPPGPAHSGAPAGLITISHFVTVPGEQVVSGGLGWPQTLPSDTTTGAVSLTTLPAAETSGLLHLPHLPHLPHLQSLANVVVAGGESHRPPGVDTANAPGVSIHHEHGGAVVDGLLQGLLSASGITIDDGGGGGDSLHRPDAVGGAVTSPPATIITAPNAAHAASAAASDQGAVMDGILGSIAAIISDLASDGHHGTPSAFGGGAPGGGTAAFGAADTTTTLGEWSGSVRPSPAVLVPPPVTVTSSPTSVTSSPIAFASPPHPTPPNVLVTADGVLTTSQVGFGTWFEPTEAPSVIFAEEHAPSFLLPRPPVTSSGDDGSPSLIQDIDYGTPEVPENVELPQVPNFVVTATSHATTQLHVDIPSTMEILSTLGTVELHEEVPLKDGSFELHIRPTPQHDELHFRFPPLAQVVTAATYQPTAVRPTAVTTTKTVTVFGTSVTIATPTTTTTTAAATTTTTSVRPTTGWGEFVTFNHLGFWKPPTAEPVTFLGQRPGTTQQPSAEAAGSSPLNVAHARPTEQISFKSGTESPEAGISVEGLFPAQVVAASSGGAHGSSPFAGEPEPSEISGLFTQLPAGDVTAGDSTAGVINIQQIDPNAPMMMMPARINVTDSPIIAISPKPPGTRWLSADQIAAAPPRQVAALQGQDGGVVITTRRTMTSVGGGGGARRPSTQTSLSEAEQIVGTFFSMPATTAQPEQLSTWHGVDDVAFTTSSPTTTFFSTGESPPDATSSASDAASPMTSPAAASLAYSPPATIQTAHHIAPAGHSAFTMLFNELGFWRPSRRPLIFSKLKLKHKHKVGTVAWHKPDLGSSASSPKRTTAVPKLVGDGTVWTGAVPSLVQTSSASTESQHHGGFASRPESPPPGISTSGGSTGGFASGHTWSSVARPHHPHRWTTRPTTAQTRPTTAPTRPAPVYNEYGFWKPTKRPYLTALQRLKEKHRRHPAMAAPPPVGPPSSLPPRVSYINRNFRPDPERWSKATRERRDAPAPSPPPPPTMDSLLESVGRSLGASPEAAGDAAAAARRFRRQFRPDEGGFRSAAAASARRQGRQFSGRCVTQCWLGTVGILGGVGGLAALTLPVYALVAGSLAGGGAAGGATAAAAAAAAVAGGAIVGGLAGDEPVVMPPVPVLPPAPLPDVPQPPAPLPDVAQPPAPPDPGSGQPPGLINDVAPPATPVDAPTGFSGATPVPPGEFLGVPDVFVTAAVVVDPGEAEEVHGAAPDSFFLPSDVILSGDHGPESGVADDPESVSGVLGENFGPADTGCDNYKLCMLHAKTQHTTKRKPPRWFFSTYLYGGSFAELCNQMARKPTIELCRQLFPHCIDHSKFGLGYKAL